MSCVLFAICFLLSTTYRHGDEYLYVGVEHDRES